MTDQAPKSSIFKCRNCSEPVEVKSRQSKPPVESEVIKLEPSKMADKKYQVKINSKSIHFGQKGAFDYTMKISNDRKEQYIDRHQKREQQFWQPTQENLKTASFWSRFLLWSDQDIFKAIQDIEERMDVKIKFTRTTLEKHQKRLLKQALEHDTI